MKHEWSLAFGRLVVPLAACCLGGQVFAADENIFFSELPVVASVSRLPQRQSDAPMAVTVIDRAMLKASGVRDLNDIFRLVPGFQTYPNNTDAARVTYHGLTDEDYSPRVQVLIDGRSQYSPLFRNGVNWATLPVAIEDIERIEVVRGTNSASYGSNAFLGVINIITVDPALVKGLSVSANRGNQNVRDYTLRGGAKLGAAGDVRVTYQQKDDDGFTNQFDWIDSYRSRLFDLRADFAMTDRDVLQLSAGHVEAVTQRGRLRKSGNVLLGGSDPGWPIHDYSQSNTYMQALWRRSLSPDSDFQLRYSYVADWASDRYVSESSGLLYDIDTAGDNGVRHEIEAQHNFSPFEDLRVVWGGGWRHDALRSATMFLGNPTVNRETGRIFGNLEWRPVAWFTGNMGASIDHDSMGGTHTSPRIGGNFHLTPQNTIRLGYARAYRTGSIVDYRGNQWKIPYATADGSPLVSGVGVEHKFNGDPNMPAERLDAWDIGYLGDWKQWRMSLDIRYFLEKVPNRQMQIDVNRLDSTVGDAMVPIQNIRMQGVEYQWKWQPFESTRLMVNQTFIKIYANYLDGVLNTDSTLSESDARNNIDLLSDRSAPRHSTSMLLMQKLPFGLEASLAGYWVDRMKWTRNSEVYGYERYDGRIGYPFRLGAMGGEVAYTVQSINGAHGEFKANGQPADRVVDRRQWVSLRLDF